MKSGIAATALVAAILVGSVAGYLVGTSAGRTTTSTVVSATTVSMTLTHTMVETTTYWANGSVEGRSLGSQGVELLLSINSTTVRPNGTISIMYGDFNALESPLNVTAASEWGVQGLTWPCGYQSWSTSDVGVMRGYYAMGNLTMGSFLYLWAPSPCPVDFVFNSTGALLGAFRNATSYSFLPQGDRANISVYYSPTDMAGSQAGPVARATIGPFHLGGGGLSVSATSAWRANAENSLGSSAPGTYTVVAADEWGKIVLLHFRVV